MSRVRRPEPKKFERFWTALGGTVIVQGSTLRVALIAIAGSFLFSGCMATGLTRKDATSPHQPGSEAWWADRANDPIGARQRVHRGKVYPPFARPTGRKQQASHIFHAAHYWPMPYVCQDRQLVESIWDNQVANGWNNATTLYHYHFDPETHHLTQPGINHLRWIMETVPSSRRMAYVQSTYDPGLDQMHLAEVRTYINQFTTNGQTPPPVMLRNVSPTGRPAFEIEAIRTAEINSMPAPRISNAVQGASGGGGAGGGGGGGGGAGAGLPAGP